jgi:hypothetical protein
MMKNKQIITDDKKNPVRDCMLAEKYKYSHCSTLYEVGDGVDIRFYQQILTDSYHLL